MKNHDSSVISITDRNNYSSRVLRASRKHHGLTQSEMAKWLATTQGAISKIESGELGLDCFQWMKICQKFDIMPDSLFHGYVNFSSKHKTISNFDRTGGHKIPSRFKSHFEFSATFFIPIFKWLESKLGQDELHKVLSLVKLDPDYLYVTSHPLSSHLVYELYLLIQDRLNLNSLDEQSWQEIFSTQTMNIVKKIILKSTGDNPTKKQLKKSFIDYIPSMTSYFDVTFDQDEQIYLKLSSLFTLKSDPQKDQFNNFLATYFVHYFESFINKKIYPFKQNQLISSAH